MLYMKLAFLLHQIAIVKGDGAHWQRGLPLVLVMLGGIAAPAQATPLENWQFDPATNQLEVTVKDGVKPRYLLMAQPARLVLELPNTEVGQVKQQQTYSGVVRKIQVSQVPAGKTRIVLELAPGTVLGREQAKLQQIGGTDAKRDRWVLQPVLAQNSVSPIATLPVPAKPPASSLVTAAPPPVNAPAIPIVVPPSSTMTPPRATATLPAADYPPGLAPTPDQIFTVVQPAASASSAIVPLASNAKLPIRPPAPTLPKPSANQAPLLDRSRMLSLKPLLPPAATVPLVKPTQPASAQSAQPVGRSSPPTRLEIPLLPPEELPPGISLTSEPSVLSPVTTAQPIIAGGGVSASATANRAVKPAMELTLPDRGTPPQPAIAPEMTRPLTADIVITGNPPVAPPSLTAIPLTTAMPPLNPTPEGLVAALPPTRVAVVSATPKGSVANVSPTAAIVVAKTTPVPAALMAATDPLINRPFQSANLPPTPAVASTGIPPALSQTAPATSPLPGELNSIDRPTIPSAPISLSLPKSLATATALPATQPGQMASLPLSALNPNLDIPSELPPTIAPQTIPGAATISVPPLNRLPESTAPVAVPTSVTPPTTGSAVIIPPLQTSGASLTPTPASYPVAPATDAIEFGQPLPNAALMPATPPASGSALSSVPTSVALVTNNLGSAFLPVGTMLNLRYAGIEPLTLKGEQPRQEVLLLQTEIRDQAGTVIAPAGTPIMGRFETSSTGSRFITQAMSLPGRSVALIAQSEPLSGPRQPSQRNLLQNSGLGALAGAIVGGLSGGNVLGGAAAGAAITYVTSPKPATIQPGQILPVRLVEDLK